jgi:hypothetical protein
MIGGGKLNPLVAGLLRAGSACRGYRGASAGVRSPFSL